MTLTVQTPPFALTHAPLLAPVPLVGILEELLISDKLVTVAVSVSVVDPKSIHPEELESLHNTFALS